MSTNNQNCTCEQKIGCNVRDCKYHDPGNICRAREIVVANESARKKS